MFLSRHTVQDHLKSVFAKTGTHNRRVLLSHALGVRAEGSFGLDAVRRDVPFAARRHAVPEG